MHIISASRKTDIPTFYMDWFMNRIKEGKAYVINPYKKEAIEVSLKLEDVAAIVFWSKNYKPALKSLIELKNMGYNMYFHYTITGQGRNSEKFVSPLKNSVENFKWLAENFSKNQINWRFDPIFYTTRMQENYYLETFHKICEQLYGYTNSCYTSFVSYYTKVENSIKRELIDDLPLKISIEEQKMLMIKMQKIATKYKIQLYSCCQDHLSELEGVEKGSCINSSLLSKLFGEDIVTSKSPSREQCGCYKSYDIGIYNSCPHGCVYCYANISQRSALKNYRSHETSSKFILEDNTLRVKQQYNENQQLSLFD